MNTAKLAELYNIHTCIYINDFTVIKKIKYKVTVQVLYRTVRYSLYFSWISDFLNLVVSRLCSTYNYYTLTKQEYTTNLKMITASIYKSIHI